MARDMELEKGMELKKEENEGFVARDMKRGKEQDMEYLGIRENQGDQPQCWQGLAGPGLRGGQGPHGVGHEEGAAQGPGLAAHTSGSLRGAAGGWVAASGASPPSPRGKKGR